ncbi:cob(I)yrinic acid a,c-diamide adenosyltransferase [Dethiosulfovibrio sp. F2B]|uniref:cob(I)yrinic acid a,c-diamide adenosyltransferase n=1 Tax=Dethiosulfovibrio faecalis TaxID=2720018 RepID=UPI001F421042|nr:cob(I)yrinic acid a,c-diamide adenosyltransferase [Dethiosulfovibrio faecalis]
MRDRGLMHVYYGTGKGKTTAALGLAIRALGAGFSVGIVQFMKGYPYSEVALLEKLNGLELVQTGRPDYVYKGEETDEDLREAARGMEAARRFIYEEIRDLVILDEVSVALDYGLLKEGDLLELIDNRSESVELVVTGRYPSEAILERGDYLSEIVSRRHPYDRGVLSRNGIDH